MTREQVEARDYCYVQVFLPGDYSDNAAFLVGTPYTREALKLAGAYLRATYPALADYWDEPYTNGGFSRRGRFQHYDVYPRNYVPRSRALLEQGRYIDADGTLGPGLDGWSR